MRPPPVGFVTVTAPVLANGEFSLARYVRDMLRRPATKTYCIFFTPRSGSSWLTGVLTTAGGFGNPDEPFNPAFITEGIRVLNAHDLGSYVELLRRRHGNRNAFGFEAVVDQVRVVFGSHEHFFSLFPPRGHFFFLIREDIVEQAVSLAKAIQTQLFHSNQSTDRGIMDADGRFEYSAADIAYWLRHVHEQEMQSEAMFARFSVAPVRLSYESMMARGAAEMVSTFSRYLDVVPGGTPRSSHKKLGTEKNRNFALRFRTEHPLLIAKLNEERKGRLRALGRLPDMNTVAGQP